MPWTLDYHAELRIVEVKLEGEVLGDGLREATSQSIALAREHEPLLYLIDASAQTQTGTTVSAHALCRRAT